MTSNCSTLRSMLAAMLNIVHMDVIFTTVAKISSKSNPFFLLESLHHNAGFESAGRFPPSPGFNLYTHLFRSVFFPFNNFVSSYIWFSCRESISSTFNCGYPSLLPRSFLVPPHRLRVHVLHPEISLTQDISCLHLMFSAPIQPLQPALHPS